MRTYTTVLEPFFKGTMGQRPIASAPLVRIEPSKSVRLLGFEPMTPSVSVVDLRGIEPPCCRTRI
jgi:hypothetical protein